MHRSCLRRSGTSYLMRCKPLNGAGRSQWRAFIRLTFRRWCMTAICFKNGRSKSVTANTRQDGLDLFRVAAEIPVRTHTQAFRLEEANQALQALKAGTINGAGILTIG